jgi:hypothetical protein
MPTVAEMPTLERQLFKSDGTWEKAIVLIKSASNQDLKDCWNSIHAVTNKHWLHLAGAIRYEIETRESVQGD